MLIIDPTCPKPYSSETLATEAMGGTEATVVRLVEAMPDTVVMQHCRTEAIGAQYRPLNWDYPEHAPVVVLRDPVAALEARKRFPLKPVYLWLHDLASPALGEAMPMLRNAGIEVLCVSMFHRFQVLDATRRVLGDLMHRVPKVRVVYNPISNTLNPDNTEVNPNKLVFFSSPHKGLAYTLETFQLLRKGWNPKLELHISNPGYFPLPPIDLPGVVVHGALTHAAALHHVREAFCVYYPNTVFPETFGLVFAEANAVGTPVLTHMHGAAHEVLQNVSQFVDCRNKKELFDRFDSWASGNRPKVQANEAFRLNNVVKTWKGLE